MTFKPTTPDGCRTSEEHERALVQLAEELETKARAMLTSDVRIGISAGKELALAAIRARKQASELALAREQAEHTDYLMREYQRMKGLGGPERPALRRKSS